jgi:hypothetical protein
MGAVRSMVRAVMILGAAVADLQSQTLGREQGSQVFEEDLVLGVFRLVEVDLVDLQQGEVAFALFRWPILPEIVSPVRRLKRRIWLGET